VIRELQNTFRDYPEVADGGSVTGAPREIGAHDVMIRWCQPEFLAITRRGEAAYVCAMGSGPPWLGHLVLWPVVLWPEFRPFFGSPQGAHPPSRSKASLANLMDRSFCPRDEPLRSQLLPLARVTAQACPKCRQISKATILSYHRIGRARSYTPRAGWALRSSDFVCE
jgi:hypothetical protein